MLVLIYILVVAWFQSFRTPIVIGAQHRPFLETTILGTTSIRAVRHATVPALTVARKI